MHPERICDKHYMLEHLLCWRLPPSLMRIPGVKDAFNAFLAQMSWLLQQHVVTFATRHSFSVGNPKDYLFLF